MARCTPNGRDCTTVGYSIIGDEASDKAGKYSMIHDLMKVSIQLLANCVYRSLLRSRT